MTPYYQDDHVTIYHGDCREFLPAIDTPTAILTDPPYGVGYDYGDEFEDIEGGEYWQWFADVLALMRTSAPLVAFTHRLAALRHIGDWEWLGVWNKPLAMSGLNAYPVMPHWEPIFLYGIKMRKDLPRRYDVISVNPDRPSPDGHPCPKPVGLMTHLIEWLAPTGVVADPFMGSGTTLRAAKDLGRKAIGIEISERYCEIAARRMGQEVLAL